MSSTIKFNTEYKIKKYKKKKKKKKKALIGMWYNTPTNNCISCLNLILTKFTREREQRSRAYNQDMRIYNN